MIERIRESAAHLAELLAATAHNVGKMARTDGTEREIQSEATVAAGYLSALLRVIDHELHTIFLRPENLDRTEAGSLVVSWMGVRLVIRNEVLADYMPRVTVTPAPNLGPTVQAIIDDIGQLTTKLADLDMRIRMAEGRLDTGDLGKGNG